MTIWTSTNATGSALTFEKIDESIRKLNDLMPKGEPVMSLFGRSLNMKVFVEPEVPKIQVRDIKMLDGTSILSEEFRKGMNEWLLERFGYREPLCKDNVLIMGDSAMLMSKKHYAMIKNFV